MSCPTLLLQKVSQATSVVPLDRIMIHGELKSMDLIMKGFNMLDFPAIAIILRLTLCPCHMHDLFLPQH